MVALRTEVVVVDAGLSDVAACEVVIVTRKDGVGNAGVLQQFLGLGGELELLARPRLITRPAVPVLDDVTGVGHEGDLARGGVVRQPLVGVTVGLVPLAALGLPSPHHSLAGAGVVNLADQHRKLTGGRCLCRAFVVGAQRVLQGSSVLDLDIGGHALPIEVGHVDPTLAQGTGGGDVARNEGGLEPRTAGVGGPGGQKCRPLPGLLRDAVGCRDGGGGEGDGTIDRLAQGVGTGVGDGVLTSSQSLADRLSQLDRAAVQGIVELAGQQLRVVNRALEGHGASRWAPVAGLEAVKLTWSVVREAKAWA